MKANHFLLAASMALALPAYAGIYFDIGIGEGIGRATETYGEENRNLGGGWYADSKERNRFGFGVDYGLKFGGGFPNVGYGMFFVGELSMEFSIHTPISYLLGPGIIFYPIRNLQLGSSIGLSPIIGEGFANAYTGTAFNLSIAYDFFKRNHGLLVGMKYYNARGESDRHDYGVDKIETSMISIFIKYTYRKKGASITD